MNLLIFIFLIIFLILAELRFRWAVLFLLAALPSYLIRFKLGVPFTLLEAMILIVFSVWFLENYKIIFLNLKSKIKNQKSKIINYPFGAEMILVLAVSFLAAGVGHFSSGALGIWKAYFFEPVLLSIVLINTFRTKDVPKMLWALAVSALGVSLLAIYQKITGQLIPNPFWAAAATRRVTSVFGYPNAVGLFLEPLTLLFFGWLISVILERPQGVIESRNEKFKIVFISSIIVLSLLSIIFARSVGASIGVAAGLIVFSLLAGKKSRLITIALLLIAAAGIFSYQPSRHLAVKYLSLNDFSGQVRRAQWRETWKMLKDGRLITGAGLDNYQAAIKPYHQPGIFIKNDDPNWLRKVLFNADYRQKAWQPLEIYMYPHNILLNFWSELGLAGLLLFIWIIGKFLYTGIKLIDNWKLEIGNLNIQQNKYIVLGLVASMMTIIIHGLVDVPYFKNDLSTMFWVFISILSIYKIHEDNPAKISG